MAENTAKTYLDQAGLSELVSQIKTRYDGSFTDIKIEKGTAEDKDVYNQDTDSTITYLKFKNAAGEMTPVDASQFVKDGMLNDVEVITLKKDETVDLGNEKVGEGTKLIKFTWNTDAGDKVDYIKVDEIGKVYSAGDGVDLSSTNAISVKAGKGVTVGTDGVSVKTSQDYAINRGASGNDATLANLLKAAFPSNKIPAGITFEQFISALAQKEIYTAPAVTVSGNKITLKDLSSSTTVTGYNTLKKLGLYTDISTSVVGGAVVDANPSQKYTPQYSASGDVGFHGAPYTIASYTYVTNAAPSPNLKVVFNNGYKTGDSTATGSQTLSKTGTSTYKPKGITVSLATKSGNKVTPIDSTSVSGGETATSESTNIVVSSYNTTLGKGTTNYVHQAALNKANAGFSGSFTETLNSNPIFVDGNGNAKTFQYLSNLGNASDDETWSISDVTSLTNKSNGKFEFTDATVAASTTSKVVSVTGYYPIFTNIIPTVTKASKGSSAIITDCVLIKLDDVATATLVGGNLTTMGTETEAGKYSGNGYLYPLPIDCYNKNAIILGHREGAGTHDWDFVNADADTLALKIRFANDSEAPAIFIAAPTSAGTPSLYYPHPTAMADFLPNAAATVTTKSTALSCKDVAYTLWEIKNNGKSEQIVITFTTGNNVLS